MKLDFLYGVCMGGKYYRDVSRLQALREGLETIKEAVGADVYLLGCGCPLQAGLGLVEAMRIGLDTGSPIFRAVPLLGRLVNTFCYRQARRNISARSFLHQRWWNNDPDCLLVSDKQQLHPVEREAFVSLLVMTGGQIFLGDSLKNITEEQVEKYLRALFSFKDKAL